MEVNFILKEEQTTKNASSDFVKFLIALHLFFYCQHNKQVARIGYTYKPLYMSFKKSWCKFIGRIYYLVLFILPLILAINLITNYKPTFLWFVELIVVGPWFIISLINLICDIICKIRIKAHNASISKDKSIVMRFGNPGAGKTSSLIYDLKILADIMWNYICIEYKLLQPYLNELAFFPAYQRERAEEIIEAYNFYKNSGTYPCLFTSIPVFVDGVPTNVLEGDHLMQEERLPYGAVCLIDESRIIIPPELHRTNPDSILNMAKFCRHYGDFHFGLTDQAKEGAFNAWRRCTAENLFMEKQKWVLRSRFLIWLKGFLTRMMKKPCKWKVTVIRSLEKITSCIGYRKYYYSSFGNEYKQIVGKTKSFILPTFLNAEYDDRSCRKGYMCLNKPLKAKKWTSKELTNEQLEAIFSKKIKDLAKGKKNKGEENGRDKENSNR